MTITDIPTQLAREFERLGQRMPGDNAQPVATFTVKPWEAYTLAATLQATSRHPGLSDRQRELVLGFAHQVADQLVAMCRALLGPDSAIETTTAMGFDPQFDVDREGRPGPVRSFEVLDAASQELPELDEYETLAGADEEEEPESHVIGERRCRYVEPAVMRLSEREAEMELRQCAGCNRFFLQEVPLELFQDLGGNVVLGFHVCERCAPSVMQHMRGSAG